MTKRVKALLHVCHAPADEGWVRGLMLPALGLATEQYHTRADDELGAPQIDEIARAVDNCRVTVLVASNAARWDRLAQVAASLAQHAAVESGIPRFIAIARDFSPGSEAELTRLSLGQRALVCLDCSNEERTRASLKRLREHLGLKEQICEPPECPYPGLDPFTATNSHLLFGRDGARDAILHRIRECHTRILLIGPSGSGKSSLIHAAVLPALRAKGAVVQVVGRGSDLATALRASIDMLEVTGVWAALDDYLLAVRGGSHTQVAQARARLANVTTPDARRRIVVIDPLEEVFAGGDATLRETLFHLLSGLWSLQWCTVILCMRADFYGALMAERCWNELENSQYPVPPLDEAGLRAAIVEPAARVGVHVDVALVERLIREVDRDRSSVPLPLLQVALKELWARLSWRYLTLEIYERIVSEDQRGLAAVLAVHADRILQTLTEPSHRAITQRVLLDLIHLGEGRPHTRRRRTFDELKRTGDAPGQLERVLDTLVAGRLITTSDGDRVAAPLKMRHFDLAHDALIGGWRELSEWVQHRQGDLIKHRRLEAWAREWVDGNRTSGLLDEGDTAEACAWRDSSGATALGVSPWLVELIEASEAAHARARREKEDMIALLLEEQRKTRASIAAAVQVADQIVFQVDANLRTVPGASRARAVLLEQSRALLESLRALGGLEVAAQRTEMVAKLAQADFAFEHGRLSEAEQLLREVRKHAAKQMKTDPTNPEWQHDLSVSYDRLGAVAFAFGHLDDARRWFKKSLALSQALANADPANLDRQRDLAALYGKIGDVAVAVGKPGDAATWLWKALAMSQPPAEAAPANTERQRDLAVLYSKMGDVAVASRHIDDARRWFERSLAISRALVTADSGNAQRQHDLARWQHDLAVLYSKMGDLAVATGKLDDARAWFEKAVEALADADSDNPMSQRDLLVAHLNVALTEPTAQRHVEQAIAIYERLRNAGAFLGDVHFDQIGEFLDQVRHR